MFFLARTVTLSNHHAFAPVYAWFTEVFETAALKGAKALLDELA